MTNRTLCLKTLWLLSIPVLLALPSAAGEKPGPKFEFKDKAALDVDARCPARLSPDGKTVLYVRKVDGGKDYAYFAVGADGKNDRKVFASTLGWDDPFTFCFGKGIFSPDGKRFAALTTSDGKGLREEGLAAMRLCALDGKSKPEKLPSKAGRQVGTVFAADGSVIFPDGFPKSPKDQGETWSCTLRRVSPQGKVSTVIELKDALLLALTASPRRDRVAAVILRKLPEGGRGRPEMRLWACDLASGKTDSTGSLHLDDYFYDGGPALFWSLDGRCVYTNGNVSGGRKSPFSLLKFEPFKKTAAAGAEETKAFEKLVAQMGANDFATREKATRQLRAAGPRALAVLHKAAKSADPEISSRAAVLVNELGGKVALVARDESLISLGELAPGKLSVAGRQTKKCYVLDAASGSKTELPEPLLLVDRSGSTGLFANLETRKLVVAKIEAK